jgi:hypothetical protein
MATQKTAAVTKRRFLSGLNVSFGVMEMTGDLFNPVKTNAGKEERFKLCCPKHALQGAAVAVTQQYACSETAEHGPFAPSDCERAKEIDKTTMVLVDKDAIAAANAGPERETNSPKRR